MTNEQLIEWLEFRIREEADNGDPMPRATLEEVLEKVRGSHEPSEVPWSERRVRCQCGWMGPAGELKQPNANDTRYRCPKCNTEFRAYPLQHVNAEKSGEQS